MSRVAEALGLLWVVLSVSTAQGASSSTPIAARIDGDAITIATVDAMSPGQAQRLRTRLAEVARRTLEQLIDERLGIDDLPERAQSARRAALYVKHEVELASIVPEALESPLPPNQTVAVIDHVPITAAALERAAALRLYRLRGELYLQRRRDLDRLIERRLMEIEARSRGTSLQKLEYAFSQADPVDDAEIESFIARERAAGRNVSSPERVRPYLEFRKRYQRRASVLNARRAKTQIRIELEPPVRPRLEMDTRNGVHLGARDGDELVAYTNYTCALCRKTHAELDRLVAGPDPPHIVLHDFAPDPVSKKAAALGRCAAKNGRAVQLRTHLLGRSSPGTGERWPSSREMQSFARIAGMTTEALRTCIESREIRREIEKDTSSARRLGFDDPPAFIAEGIALSGMQSSEELREALSGHDVSLR